MLTFEVDKEQIDTIEKALSEIQKDSKTILKKAINRTAKEARKQLAKTAKETYAVKISGFNKSMTIKSATVSKTEAIIKSKGEALEIGKFRASPFRYANGKDRPKEIKAKVLTASSMKALVKGDTKAFVARFKSGHVAVVERNPDKKMASNPKKSALKKLLSPSLPQMLGNEKKIYNKIEPQIKELLQKNIKQEVERTLQR